MKYFLAYLISLTALLTACATIPVQGDRYQVVTKDDWTLTIEHLPAAAGTAKRKYPILICHGIAVNRHYFKIKDQDSLAVSLQRAGYDVWLMDLRGRNEASETGYWFGKHTYSYSVDDYVQQDLDAAIGFVLQKTGADKVNYLGHSMGSLIMYARLGTTSENRVANFVAVAPPVSMLPMHRWMHTFYSMRGGMILLPVLPFRPGAIMISAFPEVFYGPFANLVLNPENTSTDAKNQLMRKTFNNVSKKEINQFIANFELGGMHTSDGKVSYRENLKNVTVPMYIVAGRRDELVDPAAARDTWERVASRDKTFDIISRADGHSDDYGHVDLIIGKEAHKEVFPKIVDWLNKRN